MECSQYIDEIRQIKVVCIIEPNIMQSIGASMLFESLKNSFLDNSFFRLYIVNNGECVDNLVAQIKSNLEFEVLVIKPNKNNPYLNKLQFTEDSFLADYDILLLDWDLLHNNTINLHLPCCRKDELFARSNPTKLYDDIIDLLVKSEPREISDLPSFNTNMSINTGVMLGHFEVFKYMKERALELLKNKYIIKITEKWKQEQFVISLITQELKLSNFENNWNYTLQSPEIPEEDVLFWHYNDGDTRTFNLKRNLTRSKVVKDCLDSIKSDWNIFARNYFYIYMNIIKKAPFKVYIY